MRSTERVDCAAIRRVCDGKIWSEPQPARHHMLIHRAFKELGGRLIGSEFERGFLTSTGRFVSRYEGVEVARRSGQLAKSNRVTNLTLEDLW